MSRFTTAFIFSLAAAGLLACDANDPTGPAEPAAQAAAAPTAGLEADLTAGQSALDGAAAGSLNLTATRLPKSFYVNPVSGKNTNPGTKLLPFKTLARALSSAIAKDTVRLATGIYSAATNGERFTYGTQQVVVPAGVLILGTLAGDLTTQLRGTGGETGLNLKGGATVRNLILGGFLVGVRATQGVQSLNKLTLDQNVLGLDLSGSAQAALVLSLVYLKPPAGGFATGARVTQQAQFTMSGGIMTGGGPNCAIGRTGVELHDAARATFKNNAALTYIAGNALDMRGNSKATLTGFTTIDRDFSSIPGGCFPAPSVITFDAASLTLQNARVLSNLGTFDDGIESHSSAPLTLAGVTLSGHSGSAIRGVGDLKLAVSGSTFSKNRIGIDVPVQTASITITGSTLTENTIGIKAPFFKLRSSVVTLNQTGIVLTSPFTDLGQTTDPGNNSLGGNALTGARFDPSVITGGVGGFFASGNTWNAFTQGSNASGQYPGKPLLNNSSPAASGKSFQLPATGFFQIQL